MISKNDTYKLIKTKNVPEIISTKGVKGKAYYYKVVLKVYDDKGDIVTKTTLDQCGYGYAKWTAKTVK